MENYRTPEKLNQRISVHEKYSVNRQGYGNWIFSHYELRENLRILECGCGTGDIWKNHIDDIPKGCALTLTDASEGMVADDSEEIRIVCCFLSRKKLDLMASGTKPC